LHISSSKYTKNALVGGNMQKNLVDIPDSLWLQSYFSEYANPNGLPGKSALR
jgi:hypothetical protein